MQLKQYTSVEQKKKIFNQPSCHYELISDASVFDEWYKEHSKLKCYFRGVKEAAYKNYTSAQREYITHDYKSVGPFDLVKHQINSLRESHEKLLQLLCKSNGSPCSDFFLMSFAQHYGGISPLIDFSKNLDVSLFFACEYASFGPYGTGKEEGRELLDNYISIYSLSYFVAEQMDLEKLIQKMADDNEQSVANQRHKENPTFTTKAYKYISRSVPQARNSALRNLNHVLLNSFSVNGILSQMPICFISNNSPTMNHMGIKIPYVLRSSNINLVAQKGCFVYHNEGISPLEEGLSCTDIHKSLIPYIQKNYLLKHNITQDTIFPNASAIVAGSLFDARAKAVLE